MTGSGLLAILPLLLLSAGAVVLMLQISFIRNASLSWVVSLLALSLTLASTGLGDAEVQVTPLLLVDPMSRFFSQLFLASALIVTLLSRDYLTHGSDESEEYYLLLLLSTLGALVLTHANHLASLLLGLELLGVALYALIAYPDRGRLPLEAAIKYLVLSGAASAILLFGFALLYAATGSLEYAGIGLMLTRPEANIHPAIIACAGVLVFSGLAFKLSLVPFHLWTPDVYQGAPAPVAGFLATVSKGAIFVALLRWYLSAGFKDIPALAVGISALAIASMLVGNLLALQQQNLKRLLAYSSIAHLGYLVVIVIACSHSASPTLASEASAYYLVAYTSATLAAFALIGMQRGTSDHAEIDTVASLTGLFWHRPVLALMLSLAMFSLAGIPLTAGFIAKFYIFHTAIDSARWALIAAMVIGSGIGIYYYLRIVFTMSKPLPDHASVRYPMATVAGGVVVIGLIAVILYLGIFPQPLMQYLNATL